MMKTLGLLYNMTDITRVLRFIVFIAYYLLCVRFVGVYLNYLTGVLQIAGLLAAMACFLLVWWRPVLTLFLFIASVPLISGIQGLGIMKVAPLLSFGFSIIYISWFSKRFLWKRNSLESTNTIGDLIDVLSGIVCLSILVCFFSYPFYFSIYRLQYASIMGQADPFWFMEAGFIMLQGLFLYRMIELEKKETEDKNYFGICLYCQLFTILIFSALQLFYNIPVKGGGGTIYSPFQDIHSYGGYLLILLFWCGNRCQAKQSVILIFFSLLCFICIYFSGSTSSIISFIIVGFVWFGTIIIQNYRKKIILLCVVTGMVLSVFIAIKYTPNIYNRYSNRLDFSTRTSTGTVNVRFQLWARAIGIIEDFPLTGSGVGTFYKISTNYEFGETLLFGVRENAHNYYFQFAAELGTPALILFFFILFFTYKKGLQTKNNSDVKGLLFGLSGYLISMMSGHHLILSTQQFLFWFVVSAISFSGTVDSEKIRAKNRRQNYVSLCLTGLIVAVCVAHVFHLFISNSKVKGLNEYGLYQEQDVGKKKMRWAMKYSGQDVLAESDAFGFSMYAEPENVSSGTLETDIYVNDTLIDRVTWNTKGIVSKEYTLPGIEGRTIHVKTVSSDSYNPYKKGLSHNIRENRDQSFAMSDIVFKSKDD